MKSKIINLPTPEPETYPILKISKNAQNVVLFSGRFTGTLLVVEGGPNNTLGDISENWAEEEFVRFTGSVMLENTN